MFGSHDLKIIITFVFESFKVKHSCLSPLFQTKLDAYILGVYFITFFYSVIVIINISLVKEIVVWFIKYCYIDSPSAPANNYYI